MARLLSSTNLVRTVEDAVAIMIKRKGYCAAAAATTKVSSRPSATENNAVKPAEKQQEGVEDPSCFSSPSATPWVPDPVTGCYRPGNQLADGTDIAAPPETLLPHRD